jgi:hypothetical protein
MPSRELGFELSLQFERLGGGEIFASMPVVAARKLLGHSGEPPEKIVPSAWERLLHERLQDCEEIQQISSRRWQRFRTSSILLELEPVGR